MSKKSICEYPRDAPILEDGLPHIWRYLNNDDIKGVLEALPSTVQPQMPEKGFEVVVPPPVRGSISVSDALKEAINFEIWVRIPTVRELRTHRETPHQKLKKLSSLRGALNLVLRRFDNLGDEVQSELVSFSTKLPREELVAYQISSHSPDPGQTIDGLKRLRLAIASYETSVENIQRATNSKTAPKPPDIAQCSLISALSHVFEGFFGAEATSHYRDGPWCKFLAAVLSRCRDTEVTNERAFKLWRDLSKNPRWQDLIYNSFFLSAAHPALVWRERAPRKQRRKRRRNGS